MAAATIPGHIIKIDDDVEAPIASIWEGDGTQRKKFYLKVAHLISAAPELLAALKPALPLLDAAEQDARERGLRAREKGLLTNSARWIQTAKRWLHVADSYKADADAARAAISKAKGLRSNKGKSVKRSH